MTINVAAGAAAYANAARQLGQGASVTAPVNGAGGGFADLLQGALQCAVDAGKTGDAASLGAVTGKTDINNVVVAVNNAELTLQTVLAVRDKVLAAYTEIMHMTM